MKTYQVITLRRLVSEIHAELKKLNELFLEWEGHRFKEWTDTIFLRGKASLFHDFYCGAENIFQRIAPELNGGLPEGPAWRKRLLHHMQLEIAEVRPPVISAETLALLGEFLDFRHKSRHMYGFDLDFKKLDGLERIYPDAHQKFGEDIDRFVAFLEGLITAIEKREGS